MKIYAEIFLEVHFSYGLYKTKQAKNINGLQYSAFLLQGILLATFFICSCPTCYELSNKHGI